MGQFIDITGHRFGELTVVERSQYTGREVFWKCRCDCGREIITRGSSLRNGSSTTCDCSRVRHAKTGNAKRTHGFTGERLYRVWMGMKQRCYLKTHNRYANYGGRGITVCAEWKDYLNFRKWAFANGYDPNAPRGSCTIDRIDVDGNYEPSNCRWVDSKIQAKNRR
ncbi:hypothetical protein UN728_03745 [Streptococcus suis]|uniref:hypothetical protein n=1 Tax=Streptococcus suis TaxID=1307 RepID=UPI002AADDB01|nr:hypothetical protein [Streptococcus suis]MDY7303989.1 hypothetical protein [Streptococcus suis]